MRYTILAIAAACLMEACVLDPNHCVDPIDCDDPKKACVLTAQQCIDDCNTPGAACRPGYFCEEHHCVVDATQLISTVLPAGTVIALASATVPNGWLPCDGKPYPKSMYPKLYNAIGVTFGSTASEFKVPDLRGRVVVGVDDAGVQLQGPDRGLGKSSGAQTHLFTPEESGLPAHNHSVSDPGHVHPPADGARYLLHAGADTGFGTADAGGLKMIYPGGTTTGTSKTGITATEHVAATPAKVPHNKMPPYLVLHYLIKY